MGKSGSLVYNKSTNQEFLITFKIMLVIFGSLIDRIWAQTNLINVFHSPTKPLKLNT